MINMSGMYVGGNWGAFDSTGQHFFNPDHPIYKSIAGIAGIRKQEPALRYGRQYFREISGNGMDFGHPVDLKCTLAYSRILDSAEILVAMNLGDRPRSDFVTVDLHLSTAGNKVVNLLDTRKVFTVEQAGLRHAVRIPLDAYEMVVLKISGTL